MNVNPATKIPRIADEPMGRLSLGAQPYFTGAALGFGVLGLFEIGFHRDRLVADDGTEGV